MEQSLTEYVSSLKDPYFFENDGFACYVGREALKAVRAEIAGSKDGIGEGEQEQIETLFKMEELKLLLADGGISVPDYRAELKAVMRGFFQKNGFDVFYETEALHKFYALINNYYSKKNNELTGLTDGKET